MPRSNEPKTAPVFVYMTPIQIAGTLDTEGRMILCRDCANAEKTAGRDLVGPVKGAAERRFMLANGATCQRCKQIGDLVAPNAGPGRRPSEESTVEEKLYIPAEDAAFIQTWNRGNMSLAIRELVEDLRKVRPGGRFSCVSCGPGARLRPGTKTWLKREIRDRDRQIEKKDKEIAELRAKLAAATGEELSK